VIRVAASDVLSVDLMIRTGAGAGFFPIEPPYVPGNGVAGQVIATGDGVDPAWTGRTVAAHTGGSGGWGGYAEPGWAGRVRELTGGRGADLVFDGAGGRLGSAAFGVTADGGRFSAHGMSAGFPDLDKAEAERRGITIRGMEDGPFSPADFLRLAGQAFAQAAAGTLRPVIGQTFPLDRAADAHSAMEARQALGKSLLIS
jgi:NADPH:quinone reductase-like Zn-dependent oxidoreductase